ncbi:hypothetical protein [Coleofasciculus sp. FACHB-129]|uniref:hypothetical protein n=1 Tax=Cyanophyceae TaxID=3028117 RepID=UPI0016881A91|nr:hypothetical protein [Coleofasciculus sp. FACHB-129]MBD1893476.1 hypothetical protein [Coleofasciculus sp. FACHB-129]
MAIFRQYIVPLIVVLIFFVALVAVSARIFLPSDMAAPAPIEEVNPPGEHAQAPASDFGLERMDLGLTSNLKSIV